MGRLENAGFCRQDTRPTILLRRSTWKELDLPAREALLFHELGHCLLDRRHDNQLTPSREWASVMRGGLGSGDKRAWIRFEGDHRTAYLDALFGTAPSPSWGSHKPRPSEGVPTPLALDECTILTAAAGVTELKLHLDAPTVGSKGLLYRGARTIYLAVTTADGVTVGTLEDARPWGGSGQPAQELWMRIESEALWLGTEDGVVMELPLDEVGEAREVGVYCASGASWHDTDRAVLSR